MYADRGSLWERAAREEERDVVQVCSCAITQQLRLQGQGILSNTNCRLGLITQKSSPLRKATVISWTVSPPLTSSPSIRLSVSSAMSEVLTRAVLVELHIGPETASLPELRVHTEGFLPVKLSICGWRVAHAARNSLALINHRLLSL